MTFETRLITTTFSLWQGNFAGGGNTHTVESLRTSCRIEGSGGGEGFKMDCAIYGLPLSVMNQVTTLGRNTGFVGKNTIDVMAGGSQSGMKLAFHGVIVYAWVDAQAMPQVCLRIQAFAAALANVQPSGDPSATTQKGQADSNQLFQQLAGKAGLSYDGNASVKLMNPYLWGSIGSQIKQLAHTAGLEHIIQDNTLRVWKPGESAPGGGNVSLSAETGMVSYPAFDGASVLVKSIWNPDIKPGGQVTISSAIEPANGTWNVTKVTHEIESNFPNGKWFTIALAAPVGGGGGGGLTPGATGQ